MVLQSDADKLRQTNETVSREDFYAAVQAILGARRIYILGVRSASVLVNFMGYYTNYMFDNVHIVTTSGASEIFENLIYCHEVGVVNPYLPPLSRGWDNIPHVNMFN
jgi:DNA-binding MurR/RpiR family transcriptional regulator